MTQAHIPPRRPTTPTTQERFVVRQLGAIAGTFDYHRLTCIGLEQAIAGCPQGRRREQLLRNLLAARQAEHAATLDLRDAAIYLAGMIRPVGAAS